MEPNGAIADNRQLVEPMCGNAARRKKYLSRGTFSVEMRFTCLCVIKKVLEAVWEDRHHIHSM